MTVEAGEQCRSTRAADRIPNVRAIKTDTARCNTVNIRGLHQAVTVGTDGTNGVVIGENKHNIWTFSGS
jgi:hypothetical protein